MSSSPRQSDASSNSHGNNHGDASSNSHVNPIDISSNVILDISYSMTDVSFSIIQQYATEIDCSSTDIPTPIFKDLSVNYVVDGSGYEITYKQGSTTDSSYVSFTQFDTTDPSFIPQIDEDLLQVSREYNDEVADSSNNLLLNQIRYYASEINCSDFHGKGSIDDYKSLFQAASKIANESKQIQLDIDIEGFNEFGQAADDLSKLFNGFIMRLENVNIISDTVFLTAISNALSKIVNLSKIFNQFKATILATSTIQIPKSAHDTSVILKSVMDEINCAMGYIGHFVDASSGSPAGCELSIDEQNVIKKAVNTIDNWNILCEQGVSITLQNDSDIKFITQASKNLVQTTSVLKTATSTLRSKLASMNYC
jgi:hypothetical protein